MASKNKASQVFTVEPYFHCVECKAPLAITTPFHPLLVSEDQPVRCGLCGASFTLWSGIMHNIKMMHEFRPAQCLGVYGLHIVEALTPAKSLVVDFKKHLPAGARLLSVEYTPQGFGGFPTEFHGNSPRRFEVPSQVILRSVKVGKGAHKTVRVGIFTQWIPQWSDDQAWLSMVDAIEALQAHRYSSVIVPANVAVEYALSAALTPFIAHYSSQGRAKTFLEDAATYSHQLNVLLPMLSSIIGMPPLPEHIRGHLNKLRDLRNDIAHRGRSEAPLDSLRASELVLAALFGFRYVKWFAEFLPKLIAASRPLPTTPVPKQSTKTVKPTVESIDAAPFVEPCARCTAPTATKGLLVWGPGGPGSLTFCCDTCEAKEGDGHRFQGSLTTLLGLLKKLGVKEADKRTLRKRFMGAKGLIPEQADS